MAHSPTKGRVIRVYRNGEPFYPGRKFVLNKARDFEVFLDKVTEGIHAPTGAVRRLCTPLHGHVVSSLDELKDGGEYVACGQERFRPAHYAPGPGLPQLPSPEKEKRSKTLLEFPKMQRIVRSGRAFKMLAYHPKTITVMRNGDGFGRGHRLLLNRRTAHTWEQVLQSISDRMPLLDGAARKLYTLDGHEVSTLADLEDGQCYVAVGLAPLKRIAYHPAVQPARPRHLPPLQASSPVPSPPRPHPPPKARAVPPREENVPAVASPEPAPAPPAPVMHQPKPPAKPKTKVQAFNFTLTTAPGPDSLTSAKIYVALHGSTGESGRRVLLDDPSRLQSGSTVVALECPDIGSINSLTLSHDNSGAHPDWHVQRVTVRDVVRDIKYYFDVNQWLSATRGDRVTAVSVPASLQPPAPAPAPPPAAPAPLDEFAARIADKARIVEDTAETQVEKPLDALHAEPVGEEQDPEDVAERSFGHSPAQMQAQVHNRSPSPAQPPVRSQSPAQRIQNPADMHAHARSPSPAPALAQAQRSPSPLAVQDESQRPSPSPQPAQMVDYHDHRSPSAPPQTPNQPAHRSPSQPRPGSQHDEHPAEDGDAVLAESNSDDAKPQSPIVEARVSTTADLALATPRVVTPPLRSPMPTLAADVLDQPPQNMQTPSPVRPATASRSSTPSRARRLPSPPLAVRRSPADDALSDSPQPPLAPDTGLADSGAGEGSAAALRHSPVKAEAIKTDETRDGEDAHALPPRAHTDGLLLGQAGSDMLVTQRTMVIDD